MGTYEELIPQADISLSLSLTPSPSLSLSLTPQADMVLNLTNIINDLWINDVINSIPQADMVLNLTPDKQHTSVVNAVMPLMKEGRRSRTRY